MTLRPLDTATVAASVARTGKALLVHEAKRFGGFWAVAAWIAGLLGGPDGPVTRLAGPEVPGVPFHHVRGLVHARRAEGRRGPHTGRVLSRCRAPNLAR